MPTREGVSSASTQMVVRPVPMWTSDEYCRKCAGLMDVKRSDAMAIDGRSLVMYGRNRFERDTSLSAWK